MSSLIINALVNFYAPLILGILYGKIFNVSQYTRRELSKIILYIFLPPLLFNSVYKRSSAIGIGSLIMVTITGIVLVFILLSISYIVFRKNIEFIMTSIYANAGYLPIPIASLILGNDAVSLIGFYILGANATVNSIIPVISSKKGLSEGLKRLKKYPPIYAILFGLFFGSLSIKLPLLIQNPLDMLGSIAPTLALIVLGLEASTMKNLDVDGVKIFLFRQLISGFLGIIFAYIFFRSFIVLQSKIIILEALMPPAVTNLILAHEYKLNATKVARIVLTATVLTTVFTIPFTLYIFSLLGNST